MGQNLTNFDDFLGLLRKTNSTLSCFTDFEKCDRNLQVVSIKLHALNFLLNKNDLKTNIFTLKIF
ncbi:DpnII family type II restriction endonuclease [Campylobacter sp.]|uniref:DpnII family type II restriction endonuclease n=1 Tax=Campylobacter sp. TaxID=205 RepID=UPI00403EEB0C